MKNKNLNKSERFNIKVIYKKRSGMSLSEGQIGPFEETVKLARLC